MSRHVRKGIPLLLYCTLWVWYRVAARDTAARCVFYRESPSLRGCAQDCFAAGVVCRFVCTELRAILIAIDDDDVWWKKYA